MSPTPGPYAEFREETAAAVAASLAPRLTNWTAAAALPVHEVLGALADHRLLETGFPESVGGVGGDAWHCVVLHEEVARLGVLPMAAALLSHLEIGTRLVADHAQPGVVEQWARPALRGEILIGYAATEAEAGSDLASTTTSARRDGNGWVLEGGKRFITSAAQADALCVLARTADRSITSHSLFLVPMSAAGVAVAPLPTLGHGNLLAEVRFEGVRLEADALLGHEGQGLLLQIRRLAHERAFVSVTLTAMADAVLGSAWSDGAWPEDRRSRLDALAFDVEAARQMAYAAIAAIAARADARATAAMAKLASSRVLRQVTAEALIDSPGRIQTHWDALGFAFAGGSDNMLLETIAR